MSFYVSNPLSAFFSLPYFRSVLSLLLRPNLHFLSSLSLAETLSSFTCWLTPTAHNHQLPAAFIFLSLRACFLAAPVSPCPPPAVSSCLFLLHKPPLFIILGFPKIKASFIPYLFIFIKFIIKMIVVISSSKKL